MEGSIVNIFEVILYMFTHTGGGWEEEQQSPGGGPLEFLI